MAQMAIGPATRLREITPMNGCERHDHHVRVLYNGLEKRIEYRPEALVKALLDHAIRDFGISQNPHTLGLFTPAGEELADSQTAEAAGVRNHEKLLLRPSVVRAGARAV
jgi:hypothetical protein